MRAKDAGMKKVVFKATVSGEYCVIMYYRKSSTYCGSAKAEESGHGYAAFGGDKMFCDEVIEKVYCGESANDVGGYISTDCCFDMAMYIAGDCREIFETAHFYISVRRDGVFLEDKKGPVSTIAYPGESIDPHLHADEDFSEPWTDYEWTLFVGEKLESVAKTENGFLLRFTDFELSVIPREIGADGCGALPRPYSRVFGTERLIDPCACGGEGVLIMDNHGDYEIRCESCRRGVSGYQCACDAIEGWNANDDPDFIGDYPEEAFCGHCGEPVDYIVLNDGTEGENTFTCSAMIVAVGGRKYLIFCEREDEDKCCLAFDELDEFNREMFPFEIVSTEDEPISFAAEENRQGGIGAVVPCR